MRTLASVALLLTSISTAAQTFSGPNGSICGTAFDENGRPAPFVRVTAIYLGATTGIQPEGVTDKAGHYCVRNLVIGSYVMSANDAEKGYPNMLGTFFALHLPGKHIIVKTEDKDKPTYADFQIPYKAATIRIKLTDASTGKVISGMFYSLTALSRPEGRMSGSSASTTPLLLPPDEDVLLTVTAPGYVAWPPDSTRGRVLNLASGATQELVIALRPSFH